MFYFAPLPSVSFPMTLRKENTIMRLFISVALSAVVILAAVDQVIEQSVLDDGIFLEGTPEYYQMVTQEQHVVQQEEEHVLSEGMSAFFPNIPGAQFGQIDAEGKEEQASGSVDALPPLLSGFGTGNQGYIRGGSESDFSSGEE
jgi:hypothetical protein